MGIECCFDGAAMSDSALAPVNSHSIVLPSNMAILNMDVALGSFWPRSMA
jgi:hypothetical protein